ncbi:high choriolytic enzyme 1-like [Protopterus annectens]|uniref:high choriolytic enzyme 1-like n=1 Tax=Protopterus annectens TaxID=7888 RepID=UPI001CFC1C58|nr:high choriolytic enzyme 1-like [Protopterus annectens]
MGEISDLIGEENNHKSIRVIEAVDGEHTVLAAYLDLAKAFDTIPHVGIIEKVSKSLDHENKGVMRSLLSPDKPENGSVTGEYKLDSENMLCPVSQILKINSKLKKNEFEGISIIFGDIAVNNRLENADRCTSKKCRWPSAFDGNVYIPYKLSDEFSDKDQKIIRKAMQAIEDATCIRYILRSTEEDYISIKKIKGCWSYVGRQNGVQNISLDSGCVFHGTVQHELLHALGFHHEQSRSDRDKFVRILFENIEKADCISVSKLQMNINDV